MNSNTLLLILAIVIPNIAGLIAVYVAIRTDISSLKKDVSRLETKQDKYNNLQERMIRTECSVKALFKKLKM